MNLQQLRYVRETARRNLSLTEAADVLNTSQSGLSKQIKELEIELGVEIFVRRGKRFVALTKVGEGVVDRVNRVLQETDNLKRFASEYSERGVGRLVIATTHNQARYALPAPLQKFTKEFPSVQVELRQMTPVEAARQVESGEADLAIATEALDRRHSLASFPCFSWRHVVVAPLGHALLDPGSTVDLEALSAWPLLTYSPSFSGRPQISAAFEELGLTPDIRLTAMDADVIKDYCKAGVGIGIISELAFDPDRDAGLGEVLGSCDLFEHSVTRLAVHRGSLLHDFAYRFIELFAPALSGDAVRLETLRNLAAPDRELTPSSTDVPEYEQWIERIN